MAGKKGLKYLYPNAEKQLDDIKKTINATKKTEDVNKNTTPNDKPTRRYKRKINNRKQNEKNIKINHTNKVYRAKKKDEIFSYKNYIKNNKFYTLATIFSVFFVALVINIFISLLTDVALGLVFFVISFTFLYAFFQEEYVVEKSKLFTKTTKEIALKQLKIKFNLILLSSTFTLPYVVMYSYVILYKKSHLDIFQNFL